jgi:hypothetical protein
VESTGLIGEPEISTRRDEKYSENIVVAGLAKSLIDSRLGGVSESGSVGQRIWSKVICFFRSNLRYELQNAIHCVYIVLP